MKSTKLAVLLLLVAGAISAAMLLSKPLRTAPAATEKKEGTGMTEKLKDIHTYTNGMTLMADAKEQYADDPRNGQSYPAGDPYILKYNGVYYLYPSTHFGLDDVRVWSSTDLVNWHYEGIAAKDARLKMAYAPEVIYWNGAFYMVTSPDGKGHYVLKSGSPTGPFIIQTDNLGMSIDGTIFIDDDGRWYFYHAGSNGIRGREMKDPYTFGPETVLKGTSMNHWTEAPALIKRNGTYFMTESGNHLMSAGYRVNYAISREGPLGDFTAPYNNPLIISTTSDFHGLGHSTTVIGPDLDSYYIAYHNNKNPIAPGIGHDRHLNVDKLVFNGDKMDVLGPTHFAQQEPRRADFYTWIQKEGLETNWNQAIIGDAQIITSKKKTAAGFTAEFNFKTTSADKQNKEAYAGAVFSCRDDKHYAMAIIHASSLQLELIQVNDGERRSLGSAALPAATDLSSLHMLRIEQDHGRTAVYFDGMQKLDVNNPDLGEGQIGYINEGMALEPDYTAFSGEVNGTSDYDAYKPLPGRIEAVHYLKGEGRGYKMTKDTLSANPIRTDDHTVIETAEDRSYLVRLSHTGDWLQYNVNVKESAVYGIDMRLKEPKGELVFAVYSDDQFLGNIQFPAAVPTEPAAPGWTKVKGEGQLTLQADLHTLKLQLIKGEAGLMGFDVYQVEDKTLNIVYPLDKGGDLPNGLFSDWTYNDRWSVGPQGMKSDSDQTNMAFTGSTRWEDYTVDADITLGTDAASSAGGLLVRVSNESVHKAQVVDGLIGYYISLSSRQLALNKLNYDSTVLQKTEVHLEPNTPYSIQVRVQGSRIQVFLNHASKPVIDYVDYNAFTTGKAGVRSSTKGAAIFHNMKITSSK